MPLPASNLLADQASPYLRQHAENPVHWRPWSQAALDEAKEKDRPILLSIGYAACHWCHVMAHESFENERIADLMNGLFVNIKVDREERPDIDQIYMAALSSMGEQGGWPLTMFLTPEARPFWGGTYFPPESRYGRAAFRDILVAVDRAWKQDRGRIAESAKALTAHVATRLAAETAPAIFDPRMHRDYSDTILARMDLAQGGMTGAPKFPNAPFLESLWLTWLTDGSTTHRDAVILTLKCMLRGGIYDHVGGGLSRYSTDDQWLVPHFEKMLYDNAQLIRLCAWAFAETGDELFRMRIESTVGWLEREMTVPSGAYAASLDADSEGEEGRFYTWTHDDVGASLSKSERVTFDRCFSLARPAGWHGNAIICQTTAQALAERSDVCEVAVVLRALRSKRAERVRPNRDDKTLSDWNGMMVTALAEAAKVLGESKYLAIAIRVYKAVMAERDASGRLPHSVLGASQLFQAFSSDYAAMAKAGLALFQQTGEQSFLDDAGSMLERLGAHHGDDGRGHFLTASDAADVPIRLRGDVDEAIPSATGQIIEALAGWRAAASVGHDYDGLPKLVEAAIGRVADQAYGQAGILNAALIAAESRKLVIVDSSRDGELVSGANRYPDPRRTDMILEIGASGDVELADGTRIPTKVPAAYLCIGQRCLPPMFDTEALAKILSPPNR